MRIDVDRNRCAGSGICVESLPSLFDQDDEGVVVVLADEWDSQSSEQVEDVVRRCPTEALSIIED